MNILRIIAICLIVVLAVPMIIISLPGDETAPAADIVMTSNAAAEVVEVAAPTATPEPLDPAAWLQSRADLRDAYSTTELNGDRIVVIEEIITQAELLNAGEATPSDTFRDLYLAARAPARLIQYCADIVQTIGLKCDVIHSDTRENAQGKLELTGHLAFVPAAALGDPSQVTDGAVVQGTITLSDEDDLKPANEQSTRTEAMERAQNMCDMLHADYGNCVLTRVTFDVEELWITDLEVLPAGTNPQRLQTSATFQVYANRGTLTQSQLVTQLREMSGS